jgi:hydroxyacylglutathione hydrolase
LKRTYQLIVVMVLLAVGGSYGRLLDVHRVGIFGSNCFILETDSLLFLIDAGYPGREGKILDKIEKLHKKLKLIVLTHGHFDHYGCAAAIKRATGAEIGIHEYDAENLCRGETPIDSVSFWGFFGKVLLLPLAETVFTPEAVCPDIKFRDEDSLDGYGLRATIIHTPGHTRGSCTVIVEDSIAFVGDLLTNSPFLRKQGYYANSWARIDSSLVRLAGYKFDIVYIGHYGQVTNKKELTGLIKKAD